MASTKAGANPSRILALLLVLLVFETADGQVAPLPPWRDLAKESSLVLVGKTVEGQLWVIDQEKLAKAQKTPDGKRTLPNPSQFVVGILSRVRVTEMLKGSGAVKKGDLVDVFVFGYFASDSPHFLIKGEECVLFLRRLDARNPQLRRTRIVLPGTFAYPDRQPRFIPDECFTPVREGFGQVILTPRKMKILDEIKQGLAKQP